ncbi:MAG: phage terminase large subunit [Patescibacteria group bacterium]|nr:phage terminase large subunit [Patescibacteria group bacterium]
MTPEELMRLLRRPDLSTLVEAEQCERSLLFFLEKAWSSFVPAKLKINWHHEAIAEHLEAVTRGEIKRLLINLPPAHTKSNLVTIAWPAWTWALKNGRGMPLGGPSTRFLCLTYSTDFAYQLSVTARRLIGSDWYQARWGKRVQITGDRDNQGRFDTTVGGSRVSAGLQGSILGLHGDVKIIDDPHKVDEVESDTVRQSVIRGYDEMLATRETDPAKTAEVIIMQRLAEDDLAGHVLEHGGFVHLNLPGRYDPGRHCVTVLGWEDPRRYDDEGNEKDDLGDGAPLWPDQFPAPALNKLEARLGPYAYAAQIQQLPVPRGGGIIKPDWWSLWPPGGEKFDENGRPMAPLTYPEMSYIVATLDTALTTKEENDPTAMVVMGVFHGIDPAATRQALADGARPENDQISAILGDNPRIMLMEAWEARLPFHEMVTKVINTCRKRRVDCLVIEAKQNGISAAQEIQRLCMGYEFAVKLESVKGDKDSRLQAVAHFFANRLVYAPDRKWADRVIQQASSGSKGAHDDLADCLSAALRYLRRGGAAQTPREYEWAARQELNFQRPNSVMQDYDV